MAADRTVTARLVADTTAYNAPFVEATKTTTGLAAAQREAAQASKEQATAQSGLSSAAVEASRTTRLLSTAQREAAAAAKEATAADSEATRQLIAAQKEVTAAAKDTSELGAQRRMAAQAALESAEKEAAAAAESKAAADVQAKAARDALAAHRDETAAARENALEETAAAKASEDAAKKRSTAYSESGKLMMGAGLGLVAAFGIAEKATSDFDKSMSGVGAVAHATAPEMEQLRTAALNAGRDTAFSAKEAADAEGELVKAGVSVKDVLSGGLTGALDLAAAGQLSLADAATISANAMNTFNLKGSDVPHIADVLAAGANKSAADVKELSYAMQQGGLVAAQTGLSFEDTTAVLSAFADRGLAGADAGTSLKTMLERLNNPTTAARDLMNSLGISAYDVNGKFVGIQNVAGQLHDKLGGLTDAQRNQTLATIFGSDAIRSATVLYSLGADGLKGYTDAVNDSGAAGRMASAQLDNLSGDLHQLKGSLDTVLIQSGGGANSVLRDMAQGLTAVVNGFGALPKWVQEGATAFAGGAGSALLLVGGLTSLAGKVGSTRKTLEELATTADGMKGALARAGSFLAGPWGIALVGAAAVAGIFISKMHDSKVEVTDFTSAIKDDGNALGDHTVQMVTNELASKKLYDAFKDLGVSQDTVTQAAMGSKDAMSQLAKATGDALKSTKDMHKMTELGGDLAQIQAISGGLHDQLHAQQQATAATADATMTTAQAAATTAQAEQQSKNAATASMQQAAAVRAVGDATVAKKDADYAEVAAVKSKTSTTSDDTAVTNAATTAKHAQAAADKSATSASRDTVKAVKDQSKATTDAATAQADAASKARSNADANAAATAKVKEQADAAKANAAANGTAADKHKANAAAAKANADAHTAAAAANKLHTQATRDSAKAVRDATTADNASVRASDAAATAADKASRADDAKAKAADAKSKAADKAAKAADQEAAAQRAAAVAAQEAADEHKWGTDALKGWADAAAHSSDGAYKLDDAVSAEVGAMKDAKTTANNLKDALDALNGVHIQAGKAAIDVQNKIHDLNKTLTDNGNTLDITTEKGRTNMSAVYDLASAINAHAQAVTEETGSVKAGNDALAASRDEFDKVLQKAGLSKQKIDDFNKSLLNTPALSIDVDASKAMDKLRILKDQWGQVLYVTPQGVKQQFATGGLITGPGTGTSDSIPIMASAGEFVVTAAAARQFGYGNLARINASASGSIVRPQMVASVGGTTAQPARATGGAALHIEHYHEARSSGPRQVADDLAFLVRGRGMAA